MIAMTTSNSINVNAAVRFERAVESAFWLDVFVGFEVENFMR